MPEQIQIGGSILQWTHSKALSVEIKIKLEWLAVFGSINQKLFIPFRWTQLLPSRYLCFGHLYYLEFACRKVFPFGGQSSAKLHTKTFAWVFSFLDKGFDENGEFRSRETTKSWRTVRDKQKIKWRSF